MLFDCDLSGADVSQVKLPGSRFHGSLLTEIKGSEYLRDFVIDSAQVLPLAKGIFAGLKIRIEDDRETDVRPLARDAKPKTRSRPTEPASGGIVASQPKQAHLCGVGDGRHGRGNPWSSLTGMTSAGVFGPVCQ